MDIREDILNQLNLLSNIESNFFDNLLGNTAMNEVHRRIQILQSLVNSPRFDTIMTAAKDELDRVILDGYRGKNTGDKPYNLGFALGFYDEQIDKALKTGQLQKQSKTQ